MRVPYARLESPRLREGILRKTGRAIHVDALKHLFDDCAARRLAPHIEGGVDES